MRNSRRKERFGVVYNVSLRSGISLVGSQVMSAFEGGGKVIMSLVSSRPTSTLRRLLLRSEDGLLTGSNLCFLGSDCVSYLDILLV